MSWIRDTLWVGSFGVALFLVGDVLLSNFLLRAPSTDYRIQSADFHHTFASGVRSSDVWGLDLPYELCTDGSGFKTSCDSVDSRQTHFDVAFIGDSFTEAVGMTWEESFVGVFSEEFPELSVANLGVSSYAPSVYLAKVETLLDRGYSFDHVIVYIDISDVQDEATTYLGWVPGTQIPAEQKSFADRGKKVLKDNLKLTYAAYSWIRSPAPTRVDVDLFQMERSAWTSNSETPGYGEIGAEGGLEIAVHKMTALSELLTKHGAVMSVAVYPWPQQLREMEETRGAQSQQSKVWSHFCESRCNFFLDYFPVFSALVADSDYRQVYESFYIEDDVHFNKQGNALLSEALVEKFQQSNWP